MAAAKPATAQSRSPKPQPKPQPEPQPKAAAQSPPQTRRQTGKQANRQAGRQGLGKGLGNGAAPRRGSRFQGDKSYLPPVALTEPRIGGKAPIFAAVGVEPIRGA